MYSDAYIVSIGDVLTSFFAGFVIFSILGFMAWELNSTVDKVADVGEYNPTLISIAGDAEKNILYSLEDFHVRGINVMASDF